ncbi:taxadiene 5-alpha hydroxylase [Tanacetum coccineum]
MGRPTSDTHKVQAHIFVTYTCYPTTIIQQGEALTFDDVKKMEYTWQVARETIRLCPPIFGSFRKATTDIQFEGITIPKDWKVLWTTYGTHYDEKHFPDPMSFNPSRSLVYPDEPILMDPLPFPSKGMPIKISPKSDN